MKRWVCERCGSGLLAPGRMRKDDVRRYCLDCSQRTGRLVERVSPALQRQREQAKTKRAEKAAAMRARAREIREAREIIDGVDVGKEIARLAKLPALRDELPARLRDRPVPWTLHRSAWASYSGHATPRGHIHLTLGALSAAQVRAVICHELAHYALPAGAHHSGRWMRCYARLVREAYGVDVRARPGYENKYALDKRVIKALGGNSDLVIEES